GTSFSAPVATGAAALLIEQFDRDLAGFVPRSSSLRALLIHGATDLGRPGPDYTFGWGLVDLLESCNLLQQATDDPLSWSFTEGLLDSTRSSQDYLVQWNG